MAGSAFSLRAFLGSSVSFSRRCEQMREWPHTAQSSKRRRRLARLALAVTALVGGFLNPFLVGAEELAGRLEAATRLPAGDVGALTLVLQIIRPLAVALRWPPPGACSAPANASRSSRP